MSRRKNKETIIIKQQDAPDITVELAKYLDVLGSPIRLNILKLLGSEPMDVELVSHWLYKKFNKISSRENTKRHIDKLLSIGFLVKQPGLRNNRAVINYVLVNGSIETAMRTLNKVIKFDLGFEVNSKVQGVRDKISDHFLDTFAIVKILGGVDDGHDFLLKETEIKIGRVDPDNIDKYNPEIDIVLSDQYRAVTRVGKPHARLLFVNNEWYIELCEGQNPTYLWNKQLEKNKKQRLKDGDIIHLAEGPKGVRLLFLNPKPENKE